MVFSESISYGMVLSDGSVSGAAGKLGLLTSQLWISS